MSLAGNASVRVVRALFILGILSVSLSSWGFYGCPPQNRENWLLTFFDNTYRTVSLFLWADGNLTMVNKFLKETGGGVCWPLQISKMSSPLTTSLAILAVLWKWILEIALQSRWGKGKVLVCGLGTSGKNLVSDLHASRIRCGVIERAPTEEDRDFCRSRRAALYRGNAADAGILNRARVDRARAIVFLCGSDAANIEAAIKAGSLLRGKKLKSGSLQIQVRIRDTALSQQLKDHEPFSSPEGLDNVSIRPFAECRLAARRLLVQSPLYSWADLRGQKRVHLVIFGLGCMGESLLIQVALVCHYRDFELPMVTVVDRCAEQRKEELIKRFPQVSKACDLEFVSFDLKRQSLAAGNPSLFSRIEERAGVTAIAFCLGSDADNIGSALDLSASMKRERRWLAPVLVRIKNPDPLAEIFRSAKDAKRFEDVLQPFGNLAQIMTKADIVDGHSDEVATKLHEFYLSNTASEPASTKPSRQPWPKLAETFRESNRRAADHIRVKLASVGCHVPADSLTLSQCLDFAKSSEIEMLSRLEHRRWCADRWIDGWRYAAVRDDQQKLHDNLVPFDDLPPEIKQYDLKAVLDLKKVLKEDEPDTSAEDTVRRELILGVVGHREQTDADLKRVTDWLKDEVFPRIRKLHPRSYITVLSPLARGADRLFAKAALRAFPENRRLLVPQPWPSDDIPKGLLKKVEWFIDLLPSGTPISQAKTDENLQSLQHRRVGAYMAERSDILVAIYDERDPRGTGEVVKWRQDHSLIPPELSSLSEHQRKERPLRHSWIHINLNPDSAGVLLHLD